MQNGGDDSGPIHLFGRYEQLRTLECGAIGQTVLARPLAGGDDICLKVLARTSGNKQREAAVQSLIHEARVGAKLHHPSIARVLDWGSYRDEWFVAFELVTGANLAQVLTWRPAKKGLAPEHARAIISDVARALQYLHSFQIVHRDVKPANIMLDVNGRPKLVDLGLAKDLIKADPQHTRHVGTPAYWAPEQEDGRPVTTATDVYALALVLYECLVGKDQFAALSGAPPDLSSPAIPADMRPLLKRCFEYDSEKRPSVEEMADELTADASRYPESQLGVVAELAMAGQLSVPIESVRAPDSELVDETDTRYRGEDAYAQDTIVANPLVPAERAVAAVPAADSQHTAVLADLARMIRDNASLVTVTRRSAAPSLQSRAKRLEPRISSAPETEVIELPAGVPAAGRIRSVLVGVCLMLLSSALTLAVGGGGQGEEKAAEASGVLVASRGEPPATGDSQPGTPERAVSAGPAKAAGTDALDTRLVDAPAAEIESAPVAPVAAVLPVVSAPKADSRQARRQETLTVGIIPGGMVYVDGKLKGTAPVRVSVTRGRHRFSGELNGIRVTKRVRIGANPESIALNLMHATQPQASY